MMPEDVKTASIKAFDIHIYIIIYTYIYIYNYIYVYIYMYMCICICSKCIFSVFYMKAIEAHCERNLQ